MTRVTFILLFVLLPAAAARGDAGCTVTLAEDQVVTLPDGSKLVLTDDHDGDGCEIWYAGHLFKLRQGRSQAFGAFSITCLGYDLPGDSARLRIESWRPIATEGEVLARQARERQEQARLDQQRALELRRARRVATRIVRRPTPRPAAVNRSVSTAPAPASPPRRAPVHVARTPEVAARPVVSNPPRDSKVSNSTAASREAIASARASAEAALTAAEQSLVNASQRLSEYEALKRLEPDVASRLQCRYLTVLGLYAYRLSVMLDGRRDLGVAARQAFEKAKCSGSVFDPFAVCSDAWSAGSKTLWLEIKCEEDKS
ncbi:MAG: hypothetical protein H6819_02205 [Phycisphaerales bacterium]|nr:hypothetical protein [Phycisphaerales bacterium]MCB9856974.1 hypothetical protein [Phycisphaerales bacterium]MCB9861899.1 hypothetical protein [Phycisphaerales bacterium]